MKVDFHVSTADNLILTGTTWEPDHPRLALLWIHGFAEHRGRYQYFAERLGEQGILLSMIDLRGHGESPGVRGFIEKFEEYFRDVRALIHGNRSAHPHLPLVLGGHSMGGLIVSRYLEENGSPPAVAAILTSPFLAASLAVPGWKASLARLLSKTVPSLGLPSGISPDVLSHDSAVCQAYAADPLVFGIARARWYTEVVREQQLVLDRADQIRIPLLVMQGLDDRIASPQASHRFFDRVASNQKEWREYPGLFHELLNETERERIIQDLLEWIRRTVPDGSSRNG